MAVVYRISQISLNLQHRSIG